FRSSRNPRLVFAAVRRGPRRADDVRRRPLRTARADGLLRDVHHAVLAPRPYRRVVGRAADRDSVRGARGSRAVGLPNIPRQHQRVRRARGELRAMTLTPPDAEKTAVRVTPRPFPNEPQFAPGTVIAGRYRIASILGKG